MSKHQKASDPLPARPVSPTYAPAPAPPHASLKDVRKYDFVATSKPSYGPGTEGKVQFHDNSNEQDGTSLSWAAEYIYRQKNPNTRPTKGTYNHVVVMTIAQLPPSVSALLLQHNMDNIASSLLIPNRVLVRYPVLDYWLDFDENDQRYGGDAQQRITSELTATLELASAGLAPRVLLALPVKIEYDQYPTRRAMVYVFAVGNTDYQSWVTRSQLDHTESYTLAQTLLKLFSAVGAKGVLLMDNKTANVVVQQVRSPDKVEFEAYVIDIDAQFSYISKAAFPISPDCAEFVNLMIFLVDAQRFLTLPDNLSAQRTVRVVFAVLVDRLKELQSDMLKYPKKQTQLCSQLLLDTKDLPKLDALTPGYLQTAPSDYMTDLYMLNDGALPNTTFRLSLAMLLYYARNRPGLINRFFDAKEGTTTGSLISGVVAVFEDIAKKHPPRVNR